MEGDHGLAPGRQRGLQGRGVRHARGNIEIGGSAGAYLGEHLCGGSIRVAGDAVILRVQTIREARSSLDANLSRRALR
jgi:formylmethanofuran dehydrogenase subunit C